MTDVIYLAHAYTNLSPDEQKIAIYKVSALANMLIKDGHIVFSPLSMYPLIDHIIDNDISHDQWMINCVWWLTKCNKMLVINHPLNDTSDGLKIERNMAKKHGVEIIECTINLSDKGEPNDDTSTEESKAN